MLNWREERDGGSRRDGRGLRHSTVFCLLPVTWRLLERLYHQGRGARDNLDGGISVLDDEPNRDFESLPVLGCLGYVFSDLLRRLVEFGRES